MLTRRSLLAAPVALALRDHKNFDLKVEVMSQPNRTSGILFHNGRKIQINNSVPEVRPKTGSLFGVRNVYKAFAKDGDWFELRLVVAGQRIQVFLNGMQTVDYVSPDPVGHGSVTFEPNATFRNLRIKRLPDNLPSPPPPVVDDTYRQILSLSARNYPVVDYHVHLKGGLSVQKALFYAFQTGIQCGIAVNCGIGFPVQDDAGAEAFFRSMQGFPVFTAMQAEGREWVTTFSPKTIAKFDYVFTDAMTFVENGHRYRLWIPEEVGQITDQEAFMDMIVRQIVGVLEREPIHIYVNPTFLPDQMQPNYDRLWTSERIEKVILASKKRNIALEINNRYRIPSPKIIRAAKAAGLKFSFGTNNVDANLDRMEYALEMVRECGLGWQDIFIP